MVSSWPTVVEGDPKTPFSIAINPKCKGRYYFFPGTTPLTLDPYLIILSVKQRHQVPFKRVFDMTHSRIEPRSLRPLANVLTIMPFKLHCK